MNQSHDKPFPITEVEVRSFKKLKYCKFRPNRKGITTVSGENDAGKSTLFDAIIATLGGKRHVPDVPVTTGEESAETSVTIESPDPNIPNMVIRRTYVDDGDGYYETDLVIEDEDGEPSPQPQTILNDLLSQATFDPFYFDKLERAERLKALQNLIGLDFTEHDATHKRKYEQRTQVNRETKRLKGAIDKKKAELRGVPHEKIDVSQLEQARKEAVEHNEKVARYDSELRTEVGRLDGYRKLLNQRGDERKRVLDEIERLQQRLEALNGELEEVDAKIAKGNKVVAKQAEKVGAMKASQPERVSTIELNEKFEKAYEINARVSEWDALKALESEAKASKQKSDKLTKELKQLDEKRLVMAQEAEWPLEGMGMNDDGVTLDDLPYEQASQSRRTQAAIALGMALNPGIRVMLVREGSLIGKKRLQEMAEYAEEHDIQMFVELVGELDGSDLIIRDGVVVDEPTEVAAE